MKTRKIGKDMKSKTIDSRIEFYNIVKEYTKNTEFQEMKKYAHHGTNRYDHSICVAYYAYLASKKFKMDVEEVTIGALLHDFYTNEVEMLPQRKKLQQHPKIACENAKRVFQINEEQEKMIKNHMFPITKTLPQTKAAWLIDGLDDVAALKERTDQYIHYMKAGMSFVYMTLVKRITKQSI